MRQLGRSLTPAQALDTNYKIFNFTTALPSDFSFARADATTCATCRNSSGKMVTVAANIPRFDYALNGTPLGILIEGSRQNKLALYNASPSATTGLSVASGSAVLSVVTDTMALALAGLEQVGNGKAIRINNSGQATQAVIEFATAFGNTNAHSLSLWARVATAHSPTLTRSGTSPQSCAMKAASNYTRYKLENVTGHAATDKMQISVPAGADLYVILYQVEEAAFCSSEIVTSGAAATRQLDRVRALNLNTLPWWNTAQGYVTAVYRPAALNLGSVDQYIASAHDGSTSNTMAMRLDRSTDKDISLNFKSGGTILSPPSTDMPHYLNARQVAAMAWKADKVIVQQGGVMKSTVPSTTLPTGLVEFSIGCRNGGNEMLWGWIEKMEVGRVYLEMTALGNRMFTPSDVLVIGAGQSLIKGHFQSQETSSAAGHHKFTETMAAVSPDRICAFADGSTGGTAASVTSDAVNYWYDYANSLRGPVFTTFYDLVKSAGILPQYIIWGQGEADCHYIGGATSANVYKNCLREIFADMRATLGNPKIIIQRCGRRNVGTPYTNTANAGIQAIRDIQDELAAENPEWLFIGPEIYDQVLYDDVHLGDAGYVAVGERDARRLAQIHGEAIAGAQGPRLLSASRSGTSVTATISHDAGTDFSPSSAISGFMFKAGGTEIAISAAVRTSATTVTLTLASAPSSGAEILYYGYDGMPGLVTANVIRDNATPSMPLRTGKVSL